MNVRGDGFSGRQFDRVFPKPVGRIVRAWGIDSKRQRQARAAIVAELAEHWQEETLVAFRDGRLGWTDLIRAKRQNRIGSATLAVDLALHRPLWDMGEKRGALSETLELMGRTRSSRDRYESAFKNLRDAAPELLPADAQVAALAELTADHWASIFAKLHELSPASRNRVRSAVSRFLSLFLADKYHPARRVVMARMGSKERENTGAPRTIDRDEFWRLMEAIPADAREALEPCYITLAATGMRVGEYLQCRADALQRFPTILIPGGKTGAGEVAVDPELEARVRIAIPCNVAPAPAAWLRGEPYPGVQRDARYHRLYDALAAAAKATGVPATLHYLRHLFGALAVDNTNAIAAQHALRHKTAGMTAHYAKRKSNREVGEKVGRALMAGRKSPRVRKRPPAKKVRDRRRDALSIRGR